MQFFIIDLNLSSQEGKIGRKQQLNILSIYTSASSDERGMDNFTDQKSNNYCSMHTEKKSIIGPSLKSHYNLKK